MKVVCLQETLKEAVATASHAVAPRTATLPVLAHFLIATENGRLKITATNLELGITCWVGARVQEEGAISVPARAFADLIALLPPDRVELSLETRTRTLCVRCANYESNLKGIDAQEFPIVPAWHDSSVRMNPATLKRMIARTVFAAQKDESRPMLLGVNAVFNGNRITMVACDGARMSVATGALLDEVPQPRTLLIPARYMSDIARIIGTQTDSVVIGFAPARGQALFHLMNVDIVVQLIDSRYLDYEQLIPAKYNTRIVVPVADLLKACKHANIFAREASDAMRFVTTPETDPGPGRITIAAHADEAGNSQAILEAEIEGAELDATFNGAYLIEALSALDTPMMAFETLGARSAGVIKPVGDDTFLHILMPMRKPTS